MNHQTETKRARRGAAGRRLFFALQFAALAGFAWAQSDTNSLAAALNAITAGSAAAAGKNQVTLLKDVTLTKALAVPAGVTLDMSVTKLASGDYAALTLGDGAALTVNGAVKARGFPDNSRYTYTDSGSLRVSAKKGAAINGSGVISLVGSPNEAANSYGGVYREESLLSVTEGSKLTVTDVTLQGNGPSGNHYSYLIQVRGEMALAGKATITGYAGGAVIVYGGSVFTMTGGVIGGNGISAWWPGHRAGGGVCIGDGGKFVMSGGVVYGSEENLPPGVDKSLANRAEYGCSVYGREAWWGDGSPIPVTLTDRTLTGGSPGTVYPNDGIVQPPPTTAEYDTDNDESSSGIVITKYKGAGGSVTIPATIGGKKVTAIGERAFADSGITKVVIPEGVTTIGTAAFTNCASLTDVVLPGSLREIGNYAFGDCPKLKNINIPNGITTVDYLAFFNCDAMNAAAKAAIRSRFGDDPFVFTK
ncbi:MAG: leucine-rich repeat domain-containing protein [Treponematales bacterium]